jgi:hypothetical protein
MQENVLQAIEQRGFPRPDWPYCHLQPFAVRDTFQHGTKAFTVGLRQMQKSRIWREPERFLS